MAGSSYQALELGGAMAFGQTAANPFQRTFWVQRHKVEQPYFTVTLKTAYSTTNLAASIRVNGQVIDKVGPRPVVPGQFMVSYESVFFPFDYLLLRPFPQTQNTFEIVNAPGTSTQTYVLMHQIFLHYREL
jgi:hypothetical protein